jgi:hypothetical protein
MVTNAPPWLELFITRTIAWCFFYKYFLLEAILHRCYSLLEIFSNFEAVKKQSDEGA